MTPPAGPRQPGRAVGLPQYVWDTRLRNYVARDTGRMVKRAAIQEALGQVCDRGAETLAAIAQAGQAGTLTPRQFYEAMQREVKQLYSASAALGKGGWAQMTASDWGKVGRELRDEYGRLAKFAAGLADGTISEAQAIARARLYADSAYRLYWQNWAAQQADLGNDEEHFRTVGDERVCFPVWMPIATRRGALAIGDVLPGDDVLTRAGWRKVQATTRRWYTGRMVRVTTDSHTLIATADHPVWTLEKGWLECGNLDAGDHLETFGEQHVEVRSVTDISLADAQHPPTIARQVAIPSGVAGRIGVPVGAVDFQGHTIQVYDLAVEGEHEFYANGILVHNCPICLEIERRGWQPLGSLPRPGEPHPGDRCALEFRNSQAAKPAQTLQPARKPEPRRATIGTVPPGPPPRKPGAGAARARLTALTLESLALAEELRRPLHYGPGPHSDGSPQAVHGGGGAESPDSRAVAAKLTAAGIENLESGNCWVMAAATYEALRQGGQQPAIIDWSGHVDAATRTPDGGWLVHTVNGAVPFAEHPMTRLKRMRAPWRVHRDPNAMIANLIGEDGILPPRQQRTVSDNLRKASRIAGARWRIPEAMALHYGPGPHASGSPQSVHAGGANPPPKPTTARPKRARERVPGAQQRLEAAVKTGKVERIEELDGGTTGAVKAEYDGFLTVFKADRGEGIAANEVAARRLALLLGDDVVPPTTYARLMDEDGSAQAFVDDLMTGGDIEAEHMAMVITDRPKLDARNVETTLALDVIMGNRDRNPGNWGIDAQGRFWAIDHGYARWKAVSTTFRLGREPLPALPYNSLGEFLVRSNRAAPAGKEPYKRLTASEMPWTWEIEPARLREWRAITREQFEAAILDPASPRNIRNRPDYTRTSYDVKPEIAWANFEALRASGKIALT